MPSIFVEALPESSNRDGISTIAPTQASSGAVGRALVAFESVAAVLPEIISTLSSVTEAIEIPSSQPNNRRRNLELEFGLSVTVNGNAIIVAGEGSATFKVKVCIL